MTIALDDIYRPDPVGEAARAYFSGVGIHTVLVVDQSPPAEAGCECPNCHDVITDFEQHSLVQPGGQSFSQGVYEQIVSDTMLAYRIMFNPCGCTWYANGSTDLMVSIMPDGSIAGVERLPLDVEEPHYSPYTGALQLQEIDEL